jgi:hypothetical protein
MKEIERVLEILNTSDYVDPAEHLYDGMKLMIRPITEGTLHDFLWALESSTIIDIDGKVKECADIVRPLYEQYKRDNILEEVLEDKYECPNCDKECFESELIEDDYAEHKGFSEELFCPSCKAIVE